MAGLVGKLRTIECSGCFGVHQAQNLAVAIVKGRGFWEGENCNSGTTAAICGVSDVSSPGRSVALLEQNRHFKLDGAHNPAGAHLAETRKLEFSNKPLIA